jgi:hypothetical protein
LPIRSGCGTLPVMELADMEITLVKAIGPGDRDRVWLNSGDVARRVAVHAVHDLPHLAVESAFGITDGLWAELAAGSHAEAGRAAAARDPRRHKHGRIVAGAAPGAPTAEWLTAGHRRAKTVTNCVTNRWGYGPDTPRGVRERAARDQDPTAAELLDRLDDNTIARAIADVRNLLHRWAQVQPGGTLRLSWPLTRYPATDTAYE